ncbi:hypothetical protein FO519_005835 [Halicephalobus sp. NKZ332]|nr:hypothetical protein FO519_005835 [Halicephalobus sp. NKZ332]
MGWRLTRYYFEEVWKSYFSGPDTVVEGPKIIPRLQRSSEAFDIGILIVLTEDVNLTEYELAVNSLRCYALIHNYGFRIERVNEEWNIKCPHRQHKWTLFIDADVGVVNPNRLLDDYIVQNQNKSDLIFFDRFFDWEIAAGSYFSKNTQFAAEFLREFANLEFILPDSFTGSDNGAIHWLFVTKFFPNTSILSPDDCWKIWEQSEDFTDLFVFEACCRQIMGESRLFSDPKEKGTIRILPKGTAWMRDIWITDSKWSLDSDFMLHGWKHSILVPQIANSSSWKRSKIRQKWGRWWKPLAFNPYPDEHCISGDIVWKYWESLMVDQKQLQHLLQTRQQAVRKDFYQYSSQISFYL